MSGSNAPNSLAAIASDSDGEGHVTIRCQIGLNGDEVVEVRVDKDATVGQFKNRLLTQLESHIPRFEFFQTRGSSRAIPLRIIGSMTITSGS